MMKRITTMKRITMMICVALLLMISIPVFASGAWTSNAVWAKSGEDQTLTFTCSVDSVDTLTSNSFRLDKYNSDSWTTYPIPYQVYNTSVLGAPKLTVYIQGSNDGTNFFAVDTLFSDDVTETVRYFTANLNNKKAVVFRMAVYGIALCRSDALMRIIFHLYRRDN